jgi:ribosomal protein S18 acetylase RimI-like enzyme
MIPLPRPLTRAEAEQAAAIQGAAFVDDPLWRYLLPNDTQRARLIVPFFRPAFRLGIETGRAFGAGEPLAGVALWEYPGQAPVRVGSILRAGWLEALRWPIVRRLPAALPIFAQFERMQKQYAPTPHYYLQTIAVDPRAQGQGLASRLIRPFLTQADARRLPTYTETITPENVSLYQHYGFRVMEDYTVPGTELHLWAFVRPPQP